MVKYNKRAHHYSTIDVFDAVAAIFGEGVQTPFDFFEGVQINTSLFVGAIAPPYFTAMLSFPKMASLFMFQLFRRLYYATRFLRVVGVTPLAPCTTFKSIVITKQDALVVHESKYKFHRRFVL